MEDPLTISVADHFHMQLDSDFSAFSFPNAFSGYPGPDTLEPSYLSGHQLGYQMDNRMEDMAHPLRDSLDFPESSHDDLNQYFTGSPFSNSLQSTTPVPRYSALKSHSTLGGYSPTAWERSVVNSTPDPWVAPAPTSSLAIITTGLERTDSHDTVLMHGQVTPGDSPSSPSKLPKPQQRKSSTRKTKATTTARRKSESFSAEEELRASPIRKRKPRKSSKKTPTAEQEAQKRETFLKRNREAAYKCRVKKKSQTEMIMERVKILDADNAVKGLEVEQLRREIEGLRALLLPHYRECGDARLVRFMDRMAARGSVCSTEGGPYSETSPEGNSCGRRASEAVFEMGGFEESMGMAGGIGGTSISSASLSGSRPQSREGEVYGGGFDQGRTSPLLDLDGMESM